MQPRTLVIIITILPVFVSNAVYLYSAGQQLIPWCNPYLDGCASISLAARSGDAIFLFRATMIPYAVLLIIFWWMTCHWLKQVCWQQTKITTTIFWFGVVGALSLIIYVTFLGSEGEVYRFMRRHGVMIFFTMTPFAQLLLYKVHINCLDNTTSNTLRYQLVILILMLLIALASTYMEATQSKTYESENIVEWNFSLLMNLYFAGMIVLWKDFRIRFRLAGFPPPRE